MAENFSDGAFEIDLPNSVLANISKAAFYEQMAKTSLSLSLKVLNCLGHEDWVKVDKEQFSQIVEKIDKKLESFAHLIPYFEQIKHNHEKWRDERNFVVHANWGQNSVGKPVAYCYRRKRLGDENDVVRAVNDCFWLAKEARAFQYEIAKMIAAGDLPSSVEDGPGVEMAVADKFVRF